MEEILSSIKRVIEESEAVPAVRRRPARTTAIAGGEEVLELHERVPFPAAEPEAVVGKPIAREPDLPPPAPAAQSAAQPAAEPAARPAAKPAPRAESLVSPDAAEASRGPLEALSRMIVRPDVAGSDTLEGVVREMLRPMLREWLDANLPGIVETMVAKEIARISGRGA